MRIAVAGQHITLETSSEWFVPDGLDASSVQELHGLWLRSRLHDVNLNVRAYGNGAPVLTAAGLRQRLRDPMWSGAPFDEVQTTVGDLLLVAGTFEADRPRNQRVREWFVTNGHRLANVSLMGHTADLALDLPSAERLVATLRFDEAPG